ncbi:MAG: abortive phage infection protein [Anaerolineales bacterium]|nr:abortive phage infection protein [Anaerolineales bacterium]
MTSDLAKYDIKRTYLTIMEKRGEIERVSRGVYSASDVIADEMMSLQARYRRVIFSNDTALYLHDLSDRTPEAFTVTVPSGYNATTLKANGTNVFYIKPDLFLVGAITMQSPHGNDVRTYDMERTICDILRSRNKMDIQIVTDAMKRYVEKRTKNLNLLFRYAKQFRILRIVRSYMEVLL